MYKQVNSPGVMTPTATVYNVDLSVGAPVDHMTL